MPKICYQVSKNWKKSIAKQLMALEKLRSTDADKTLLGSRLHARSRAGCALDYHAQVTWHKTEPASLFKRKEHHMQIRCKSFVLNLEAKQRKIKVKAHAKLWATLCFPLVLRICRSVRSVIDSYNSSIFGIWCIWINSLPYIQSSITIALPYTDRTAVIMRFSCHNDTIHKHAHICAIYTFIHKVSGKSVLTSYVVSSFIQTPLFCLGRLDIWMCLISALHRPYSELTSSFFSTRLERASAHDHTR